jgi:ferredoxin--NADP+ reductase
MTGNTASLCVRRATFWDDEMKADDPAKKGICSCVASAAADEEIGRPPTGRWGPCLSAAPEPATA